MAPLRFDNRVAIVTGAGGGLGKEYALLLAERGASVVVNDLGGSRSGDGQSTKAADAVVDEIKRKGGKAVANYDSVEEGEKLVKTALDHFGRIDIVINNAGILRDRSFVRTSDMDWDLVHRVHLRGAFQVTRAAWPHMKEQGYGRVILTSSVAGIYGNFGQANYSAAKLGLVGLNNTLAIEGQRSGIKCNVIVPMAASRLTEDVLPPEIFESLKPELIAPVVGWLCHEDCDESGSIIEAAGGWVGKYRWQRSQGCLLKTNVRDLVSMEKVREHWEEIIDMEDGDFPESNQNATMDVVSKLSELSLEDSGDSGEEKKNKTGLLSAVGYKSKPQLYVVTPREIILYALGVGVTTDDQKDLKFLFEGDPDFTSLPTFGVIPSFGCLVDIVSGRIPGLNVDLANVLHGEQYTEILSPVPVHGEVKSSFEVVEILDKGSGCIILCDVMTKSGPTPVLRNQLSMFVVGQGGFGGPRSSAKVIPTIPEPNRQPDKVSDKKTSIDQAALYRLSGDTNPLHIDPGFAQLAGFDKPILHGLCSYGIAVKSIVDAFCEGDPTMVKAMKTRFAKPVLPGQTLRTKMWKEGDKILFSCEVVETGKNCLTGGWVELRGQNRMSNQPSETLKSDQCFEEMKVRLNGQPDIAAKVGALFMWNITKNGKTASQWVVNLKQSPGIIRRGGLQEGEKSDCTLTISDGDMCDMVSGKLQPQKAFMAGKLKVKGNLMLTQKLQALIGSQSKM